MADATPKPAAPDARFLARLLGGIAFGLSVAGLLHGFCLAFERIPTMARVLDDFGAKLPALTIFVVRTPGLMLGVAFVTLLGAVIAMVRPRRTTLAVTCLLVVLCLIVAIVIEYALNLPLRALVAQGQG
jgi:type II secretory pathway component PulF